MVQYRRGSTADTDSVVTLFDLNVVWLTERGREAQWGSEPWSGNEARVGFVCDLLASGVVTVAEIDGEFIGASVVSGSPMPYVPAIEEPERYVRLLIASPAHRGAGIGRALIAKARERTVAEGIGLLRVDCWAGGDRRLVAYYEGESFVPTQEIEVRPGVLVQVFEWRPRAT